MCTVSVRNISVPVRRVKKETANNVCPCVVSDPLQHPLCGLCEAEIKKTHLAGPGQREVSPNRAGGFCRWRLECAHDVCSEEFW
jgi:hypothetical protein